MLWFKVSVENLPSVHVGKCGGNLAENEDPVLDRNLLAQCVQRFGVYILHQQFATSGFEPCFLHGIVIVFQNTRMVELAGGIG